MHITRGSVPVRPQRAHAARADKPADSDQRYPGHPRGAAGRHSPDRGAGRCDRQPGIREQVIASQTAAGSWSLLQFPIIPYPPGEYAARAGAHTFRVTHASPRRTIRRPTSISHSTAACWLYADRAGAASPSSFGCSAGRRAPAGGYTVFVHRRGGHRLGDGRRVSGSDAHHLWAGQVIADRHRCKSRQYAAGLVFGRGGAVPAGHGRAAEPPDGSDQALIPGFVGARGARAGDKTRMLSSSSRSGRTGRSAARRRSSRYRRWPRPFIITANATHYCQPGRQKRQDRQAHQRDRDQRRQRDRMNSSRRNSAPSAVANSELAP